MTDQFFMPLGVAANWTEPITTPEMIAPMLSTGIVGLQPILVVVGVSQEAVMPLGVAANWTEPLTSGEAFIHSQPVRG